MASWKIDLERGERPDLGVRWGHGRVGVRRPPAHTRPFTERGKDGVMGPGPRQRLHSEQINRQEAAEGAEGSGEFRAWGGSKMPKRGAHPMSRAVLRTHEDGKTEDFACRVNRRQNQNQNAEIMRAEQSAYKTSRSWELRRRSHNPRPREGVVFFVIGRSEALPG